MVTSEDAGDDSGVFHAPGIGLRALYYLLYILTAFNPHEIDSTRALNLTKGVTEGQRRVVTCIKSPSSRAFKIFQKKIII